MTKHPDWSDWDRWCDARIAAALAEHDRVTTEATGQALAEYVAAVRAELRKEFAEQLAKVRAEVTIPANAKHLVGQVDEPLIRKVRITDNNAA